MKNESVSLTALKLENFKRKLNFTFSSIFNRLTFALFTSLLHSAYSRKDNLHLNSFKVKCCIVQNRVK